MTNGQTLKIESCEEKIKKLENTISWYKTVAIILIIVGFLLIYFFYDILGTATDVEKDLFDKLGSISGGIVSSTFSLAGLILVYVAFLGQKQQLLYQQIELIHNKIELKLTRKEMSNQHLEMKRQNETLEIQKFENLFFQLLKNHNDVKKANYYIMDYNMFRGFVQSFENKLPLDAGEVLVQDLIKFCGTGLEGNLQFDFVFLNQINSLLALVDSADGTLIKKELYIKFVIDSLSVWERKCIYLICTYDTTIYQDDKKYILESNILDDIDLNSFTNGRFFVL